MKKYFSSASNIIASLLLMFFFLNLAVIFTFNFRILYYYDIKKLNIEEYSGYPYDKIVENYDIIIDYCQPFGPDRLNLNGFAMSDTGRIHFQDVKKLFSDFYLLFFITAAASVIFLWYKNKKKDYTMLKGGALCSVIIPSISGIFIALNSNWCFETFHKLAFNNNYWIFNSATNPIIDILPEEFFIHCAFLIIAVIFLFSLISYLTYRKLNKKVKSNKT